MTASSALPAASTSVVKPYALAAAPYACAVVAAGAYALACPPSDLAGLAWIAPALLLVPTRRLSVRRAFCAGLIFGVVIGIAITHWALHAAHGYFGLSWPTSLALAAAAWLWCSGVPYGLLVAANAWLSRRMPRVLLPLLGAWLWAVAELVRIAEPLAMPWALLAHTQWRSSTLLQIADLGGGLAISFLIALASLALGEVVRDALCGEADRRRVALLVAPPALLIMLALVYGWVALRAETPPTRSASRRVAVVQASLPRSPEWHRTRADRSVAVQAGLTLQIAPRADLIVWPENAVEAYVDRDPILGPALSAVGARAGADLLLGAPRRFEGRAYNSAFLVAAGGAPLPVYDKRRLVPFAESRPLAAVFGEGDAQGEDSVTLLAGSGAASVPAGGGKVGILICWEAIFPELARESVRAGADVLVNLSNDGWMDPGDGAAPRQHLSMAVLRAIETRRALVRAAASGISAFVDPTGAIGPTIDLRERATAIASVTPRTDMTPYVRFGNAWMIPPGIVLFAVALLASRRRRGGA